MTHQARTFLTVLWMLVFLFPPPTTHAQEKGTVAGKVELSITKPTARRERSPYYRVPASQPTTGPSEQSSEVTNVVVYLQGEGLSNLKRETDEAILDQRDAAFVPHVLPILKGTTVRFVNRDKTYHNVFSLSGPKKFNIGRRPTGEEVPVTFEKAGTVQTFCDIHSNMSAFILVLDNPMFVKPKSDGTFTLRGVPAGQYTIHAWHEHLSAKEQTVTVKGGETVTINFIVQ